MSPDIHLEFRANFKAGPQTLGVAFLQKSYAAVEDLVHRPINSTNDPNIGMQYGYTSVPHLARLDIGEPEIACDHRIHLFGGEDVDDVKIEALLERRLQVGFIRAPSAPALPDELVAIELV